MRKYISLGILLTIFLPQFNFAQIVKENKYFGWPPYSPIDNHIYKARDFIRFTPTVTAEGTSMVFELDEHLLYDTDYESYQDPSSWSISQSLEVGTTPSTVNVSPGGSVYISIPLMTAPGTGGLKPSVQIVQSSGSGNGMLGYGWNISGISSISRTGKSKYYDNSVTYVQLNSNDRFLLDGQRIVIQGPVTYGAEGVTHYTEFEDFSTIMPHGPLGKQTYFEVTKKDGTKYYYGDYDNRNAYLKSESNDAIIQWYIARIEDKRGNYIVFNYENDETNGETWLASIEYTGNIYQPLNPYNKIEFFYQTRDDITESYVAGCKLTQSRLIRKIKTLCEGELLREYIPVYYFDRVTKLNEIREYNAEGDRYNSLLAGYGPKSQFILGSGPSVPYESNDEDYNIHYAYVDFNGDGLTDYIKLRSTTTSNYEDYTWKIYKNTGTTFTVVKTGTWNFYNVDNFKFVPGDYNADGYTDMAVAVDQSGGGLESGFVYIFESLINDMDCDPNNKQYVLNTMEVFAGDLDADAQTELIAINFNVINTYKYNRADLSITPTEGTINLNVEGNKNYIADFDFNSVSDLISLDEGGYTVYKLGLNSHTIIHDAAAHTLDSDYSEFYFGNVNGDGYLDVLAVDDHLHIYCNTGDDFITIPIDIDHPSPYLSIDIDASPTDQNVYIKDYNNDGRSDILFVCYNPDDGKTYTQFYYYTGPDLYSNTDFIVEVSSYTGALPLTYEQYITTFTDFNGDGYEDIMVRDGFERDEIFGINSGDQSRFITKWRNGNDVYTNIQYASIAYPNNSIYTRGSSAVHPLMDFQGPMYVVSNITTSAGGETVRNQSFEYEEARIHKLGKGFLGFKRFKKTDNITGFIASMQFTTLSNNERYYFTYPSSISVTKSSNSISAENTTMTLQAIDDVRYLTQITSKNTTDYINDIKVSTTFGNYDGYANPRQIITNNIADDISTQGHGINEATITKNITYWPAVNSYLPSTVQILSERDGVPDFTSSSSTSYTNEHLPDVVKQNIGTSFEIWKDNSYDLCGNLIRTEITDPSSNILREMDYDYDDPYKRFMTEKTNALGYNEQYFYDPKTGQVTLTIDVQDNSTTYAYDGFNRLESVAGPGGTTTYKYDWSSDPYLTGEFYDIFRQNPDNSWSQVFYDKFGREFHRRNSTMDGTPTNVTTTYNSWSKVETVSEPYKYPDNPELITYEYDEELGRLERTFSYKHDTRYTYPNPRVQVVTNFLSSAHTKSVFKNSLGEVVKVTDAGGDIEYYYNSMGKPDSIVSPGDITFSMKYDVVGNQIELNDPNAGIISYNYNRLGQLTSQTDASNEVFNFTYDELGRMVTESNTSFGTNTYTYVENGNGLGSLESIVNSITTIGTAYSYYPDGTVESVTETIDGVGYTLNYAYDELLRVKETVYPGGEFSVKPVYGLYGDLIKLTDGNNQMIWEIKDINALGQLEQIDFGNNTSTIYDFDEYNQLSGIETKFNGSTFIQNLGYDFDHLTGNLLSRTDGLADGGSGLTEYFQYDELDRLEEYWIETNDPVVINYNSDGSGRFDSKSDLGTYHFGSENGEIPHAVTSVTGSDGSVIPLAQQDIDYNVFQKVSQIVEDGLQLDITYGPGKQRKITELRNVGNPNPIKTKTFIMGIYEIEEDNAGNTRHLYYVPGPDGEAAIYEKINSNPGQLYYIHKDYLGSYQTITDASGGIVDTLSFDPWGRRRTANIWSSEGVPDKFLFDRGYTGHEHLDAFNLINMNGRVYDPLLCQFLSPDNFVQDASSTQNYNRYTYAMNNPLKYTDPSGWQWSWNKYYESWKNDGGRTPDMVYWYSYYCHFGGPVTQRFNYADWAGSSFWKYATELSGTEMARLTSPSGSYYGNYVSSVSYSINKTDHYWNTGYLDENGEIVTTHTEWVKSEIEVKFNFTEAWNESITDENGNVIWSSFKYRNINGQINVSSERNGLENNENWRLYDLDKSDVEGLAGVMAGFGVVGAAASVDVPAVAIGAYVSANVISTAITLDVIWDYREIDNPQASDKAKLILNLVNYGTGILYGGWTIPSAIIGVIDLYGGFDSFYDSFNK